MDTNGILGPNKVLRVDKTQFGSNNNFNQLHIWSNFHVNWGK